MYVKRELSPRSKETDRLANYLDLESKATTPCRSEKRKVLNSLVGKGNAWAICDSETKSQVAADITTSQDPVHAEYQHLPQAGMFKVS
jgi:3-methyladenine DNA glycosylase AlkD